LNLHNERRNLRNRYNQWVALGQFKSIALSVRQNVSDKIPLDRVF